MTFRRRLRSAFFRLVPPKPKPLILMYHRIADAPIDPWSLAVSPTHFAEQLEVLRRTRHPLPLARFVRDLWAGTLPERAVAITFDDGYADNLFAGKQCLAAADVPAMVFLTTGYLGRPGEFWWDELARLVLAEPGPQKVDILVRGSNLRFDLGGEPPVRSTGSWRAWEPPRTARQAAYVAIWQAFRPLEDQERESLMDRLRTVFAGRSIKRHSSGAMTSEEVQTLASDGLVAIGAHTVTHPPLAELDAVALRREIIESKHACEALTGDKVTAFAYPYGIFDSEVRTAVAAAGFSYACSNISGPVTKACDILALPRIGVFNEDGDAFDRTLRSAAAAG